MFLDRSELQFQDQSQKAFEFLVNDFGFTCLTASDLRVRYEDAKVYIEINHGRQDCEVSISFGRLNTGERFSFWLFLNMVNPTLAKSFGTGIANTPETVATAAKALAAALRSEGPGIISCDKVLFDRMKEVRWWHFRPDALDQTKKE